MPERASVPRAETGFPTELTARSVLLLVLGVVALALRVASVFLPRASMTVLILLFGGFAIADGVTSVVVGLWRIRRKGMLPALFLRGALGIGLGVYALAADVASGPVVLVLSRLSRLFALWAFASGGLDLAVASGRLQGEGGRLLGFAGGVSVAVAVTLAVWPPTAIPFLVLWVAGYAILAGILLLVRVMRLV